MGVVSLFAQYAQGLGFVIMEIQAPFPDATLYEISSGELVRAEFEFMARNFKSHGHDPDGCDLIICWENNWHECPLPVLELNLFHIDEPIETVFRLEQRADDLREKIAAYRQKLIDLVPKDKVSAERYEAVQRQLRDVIAAKRNVESRADVAEYLGVVKSGSGMSKRFETRNYISAGYLRCRRCKNPLAEIFQHNGFKVIFSPDETVLIQKGRVRCECGDTQQFVGGKI